MRRPPTTRPLHLLILLLHVLASSRATGLRSVAGGDDSLVVFSSFPSFAPDTGRGPRAPTVAGLHSNFEEKSPHGVTSGISGPKGRAVAGNTNATRSDAQKTGIFLFSTLTKQDNHETSTDAEGLTTLVADEALDETTTTSDTTEISVPPTYEPIIVPSEEASSSPFLTTTQPRTSSFTQKSVTQSQTQEAEISEPRTSAAPGSLASMLQRIKSSPRPIPKPTRERKEQEDSPQQMTLAERLKALQARRAARLGGQVRRGSGTLRRDNIPLQERESPAQRRLGDLSLDNSESETRRKPSAVEPKLPLTGPLIEREEEETLNVNEDDMVGEEASLVSTTQSESSGPEALPPTSRKPAQKKRQRLSYTQRLRQRLQEARERRLSSTTPRTRSSRPNSSPRVRPTPGIRTEDADASLTPIQRRRQQFYQRLKNRTFTTRTPSKPTNTTQEKDSETTSEAPAANRPPQILSFLPTTKRPLTFREKIKQFRNRNRFIPASKRRQLTSTTTATTTTTTSTTTPPPTTITTTVPPTTIGTTPALTLTTFLETEAPDDENLLVTVPSTTESSEGSRRLQIRKMIDAMLSSKGFTGTTTTTEQVLSLLEEATSRPVFMHTTETLLRTLPEHRGISKPTFFLPGAENKESRPDTFLDDLMTTITESVSLSTTRRPLTIFAHDRKKPFLSLADKLAASHAPKRPKYEPSSTPQTSTTEEPSTTTFTESTVRDDMGFDATEETNVEATTKVAEVETTTRSFSSFTTVGVEEDEVPSTTQQSLSGTTAEDQRVKNLITKLLSQGVITMPLPDDSEPETTSTDDALPATTTETPPAPTSSAQTEQPQLTRGAPPSRTPGRFGSSFTDDPLVSTVTVDTTEKLSKEDTEATEAPQTTTLGDHETLLQTDFFQTTPSVTEREDFVYGIEGDLEENEIDAVNSKGNLHSIMRSFGRSPIRPELAAVNQVLGFSLTTDDEVSPVEVNLEKPQMSEDENIYDDLEEAATEQVMITTFRADDWSPTPFNLDTTSLSVSESSPQIYGVTEVTIPSVTDVTDKEEQTAFITEADTPVKENRGAVKPTIPVFDTTASDPSVMQEDTTSAAPHAVDPQANKRPSTEKPNTENVTTSLHKLLQDLPEKTDDSPIDLTNAFQGVSQAVMRERLHLLRLMKERQGGRTGQETPLDRLQTTSESPSTTSRISLSELIRKKTSGEVTVPEVTLKSSLGDITTTTETTVTTGVPAEGKSAQTEDISKSEAMRRFLELNKHVLQALRAKKKAVSSTEAPPPPATSTLPTTSTTTRRFISDQGTNPSGSEDKEIPPVITQVTPQSQITPVGIPQPQNQTDEGTKVRPSTLLRPVSLTPDRSQTMNQDTHSLESASASNIQEPPFHPQEDQLMKEKQKPSTPRPAVTTTSSRIPPPFRAQHPHPPNEFSLSSGDQEQQQETAGISSLSGLSDSVVDGPQVVSTTPQPFSPTHSDDARATETAKPDDTSDDASQPSEVQTEEPITVKSTTLASLLNRKHVPDTNSHQVQQQATSLPKTTTARIPETSRQPEDDTRSPLTLPAQEETTIIPQPPDDDLHTSAPQEGQSKPKVSSDPLRPLLVRGTIPVTDRTTTEHVPPSFTLTDTNVDIRSGLQGRPGIGSLSVPDGVPLPFPAFGPPRTFFPTTSPPSITFEPTHHQTRFPSRETTLGLDTSSTTESPSSFPTSNQDLTDEINTLTPTTFSLDQDTNTPPSGFTFQLQHRPLNPDAGLPPSFSFPAATNDGPLTTGSDTSPSSPLSFFPITSAPRFATFTLGRNEAFFSDEPRVTTFHPQAAIPLITTPITTVTPRVILLALPAANGSVVAGSLLPEEEAEIPIPITEPETVQPRELVTPPDLQQMITKGVTITSTEGISDRVPPTAAPESPLPSHSLLVPLPTNPTLLNRQTEQNSPHNILSQVVPSEESLSATEEKKIIGETRLNGQQVDNTRRPSLQAGHLNLNELRQYHLAGQIAGKASQGLPTPTGFQEQQIGSQVFLGHVTIPQQGNNIIVAGQFPLHNQQQSPREHKITSSQHNIGVQHVTGERPISSGQQTTQTHDTSGQGQAITNQQTVGPSQAHNEGLAPPGHRNMDTQHASHQEQVLQGQRGRVQTMDDHRQTTPGRHNAVKQQLSVQGPTVRGRPDLANGDSFEQRTGIPAHATTANQHKVSSGVQHVNERGQTPREQATSQHASTQEQGKASMSGLQQQNVHQHDTLTQQDSQGRIIQDQQETQTENIQNQHNLNAQVIQGQQGQQIIQGQSIHGQQSHQKEFTQDQHSLTGQVIESHHKQQTQTIQGQDNQAHGRQEQHSTQGQGIQGEHTPHEQGIQPQQNQQEQGIQGQHNQQGQVIVNQQLSPGQVIQDSHESQQAKPQFVGTQGTHAAHEGQQTTQGHSSEGQQFTEGQILQGQISQETQQQTSQGEKVIQGQSSQGQRDLGQGNINKHDEHQEQTSQGREAIQRQEQDVIQGQDMPVQSIPPTQHTSQEGQLATQDNHEGQQDDKQDKTEGAQGQQPQSNPPPQQSSRRGKFISGDAVLGAQRITPAEKSVRKSTVNNVLIGSGRPIITGQSVVPPLRESEPQQPQRHNGAQTTSRGRSRGHSSRNQQQQVQVDAEQRLATPGNPSGSTRGQATLGHFSNSAAGFIRGPADSFITGFASLSDELPAGGGEGEILTTVLPAPAKTSGRRVSVGYDLDGDEIPGRAGVDYPTRTKIPVTTFTCTPAMANMMFADPDTDCQVYHVCSDHQKYSFLCPNGTLFNQATSVCQWWFTVDCDRQARRLAEVQGLSAG